MNIKTNFPRAIREIENVWIPMPDGARLAARIWLPVDAEHHPVPALLEYIPYRKDDSTAAGDAVRHPYLAGHGYAAVRVDLRGSGDSDGILYDEYLAQEQTDAVEVIAWLAAQPWCTGKVGMFGISWGGFNSLQVAARRPPALAAIITVCSTDDRYRDDVHYMGGCLLAETALWWAATMFAYNARPPYPNIVGEQWREMWFERMAKSPPFLEAWLTHQRRDEFWKQGSVCEDYRAITCPVYAVGGWTDGYTNAIPRLLEHLTVPRKGLIGPWAHGYPEQGMPGPAIGFLQESLRWWDYWLKGKDTGIMREPMLRAWMMDSVEPAVDHPIWPGRWVAEPAWPPPARGQQVYTLNAGTLDSEAAPQSLLRFKGLQVTGMDSGIWSPYGVAGEFPPDQRTEDGRSLCFTSAPLAEPMEIMGFPELTVRLASDKPNALIAVRLCDVSPTGASTLVSRALLNLTHRDSDEHPAPLEPGRPYGVTIRLNAMAYSLPAGHRWRVALSPTYWPQAWPSPEPVTLSVFTGSETRLTLPLRPARPEDLQLAPFEPVELAPPLAMTVKRTKTRHRRVQFDNVRGRCEVIDPTDYGIVQFTATGIEMDHHSICRYTIIEGDPLSARIESTWTVELSQGEWRTRLEALSTMSATADTFHITNILDAFEGETRVYTQTRSFKVPRDLV